MRNANAKTLRKRAQNAIITTVRMKLSVAMAAYSVGTGGVVLIAF